VYITETLDSGGGKYVNQEVGLPTSGCRNPIEMMWEFLKLLVRNSPKRIQEVPKGVPL
jgi:hypothetical protein